VKVRIGFSPGAAAAVGDRGAFLSLVDRLERFGFDSVWFPEVLTASSLDPLTALGLAAGRTDRLKLGAHLVAVGRNPVRFAKELATLDRLSGGRLLLTFVIGLAEPAELSAYGVDRAERSARLDELTAVARRLWAGDTVSSDGPFFPLDGVAVLPTPAQDPLEVWYGGLAPSALRRCGRLADGWISATITPARAAAAKAVIDEAASSAGRQVDPEHFGMNVLVRRAGEDLPAELRARLAGRGDGVDADQLVPVIGNELVDRLSAYVEAGFSKFVLRPMTAPQDDPGWAQLLEELAATALPQQR
jgi:probable F420-dependent oxidoreductase